MDGFVTKKGKIKKHLTFLCFYSLWNSNRLDLLVRVTEHVRQLHNEPPEAME